MKQTFFQTTFLSSGTASGPAAFGPDTGIGSNESYIICLYAGCEWINEFEVVIFCCLFLVGSFCGIFFLIFLGYML
jgi:hypothetical protein